MWVKPLSNGDYAVILYNNGTTPVNVGVSWSDIGFSGSVSVRDLWARSALGNFTGGYNATVAMHDVSFVRCSQL